MEARARVNYMQNASLTPHDDFFKLQMEVTEKAEDFIQAALPAHIVEKLDLSTLVHKNESFIDPQSGNFQADVIYECLFGRSKRKVLISLLLEHKSYVEEFPHIQLGKYIWGALDRQRKNDKVLRPVLPVLFYHGEAKWEYRSFESYFEGGSIPEELKPFMPLFDYYFFNLGVWGEEWIDGEISIQGFKIALKLMLYSRSPQLWKRLSSILEGVEELLKSDRGRTELDEISLYLSKMASEKGPEFTEAMDLKTFINNPSPEGSVAWAIEQKGMEKGLEQGMEKRNIEIATKLLQDGFEVDYVIQLTGLSREKVEQIKGFENS